MLIWLKSFSLKLMTCHLLAILFLLYHNSQSVETGSFQSDLSVRGFVREQIFGCRKKEFLFLLNILASPDIIKNR